MKQSTLYEIRIFFKALRPGALELVRCLMIRSGIAGDQIAQTSDGENTWLSFFTKNIIAVRTFQRNFRRASLKGVSCSRILLRASDWQTRWKENLSTFTLVDNIRIMTVAARGRVRSVHGKGSTIALEASCVFGNGLHPTTQMMARFITEKKGKFESFLDVGCGTGILTLVAQYCGARALWAIDRSQQAVNAAARNYRLNGFRPDWLKRTDVANVRLSRTFDLVAANLFTDDLIALRAALIKLVRPGKYLAVSGIASHNYTEFRRRFKSRQLRCLRVCQYKGWAACLFKRRST